MLDTYTLSTQLIIKEALKRKIEVIPIQPKKLLILKYKNHNEYVYDQIISKTSAIALSCCDNKNITKVLLKKNNISVAEGRNYCSLTQKKEALIFIKSIGYPIVIKPINATHGDMVFSDICDLKEFEKAWKSISKKYEQVLVEKKFIGQEYRIFVSKNKLVGAINRIPANVIGDGKNSIEKLIQIKNKDPRRGDDYHKALIKIKIDESLMDNLKKQKITLRSIPKKEETIHLRANSNLSTGGDSIDVTDTIHPSVAKIAVSAIKAIPGLMYGGIDFMTKDITKSQTKDSYIIIEINSSPMISMHHFPYKGISRNVAKEIIDTAFPEIKKSHS